MPTVIAEKPLNAPSPPTTDVHELRFGYNLADLDVLARKAIWRPWAASTLPLDEQHQIAWSAIAQALYAADERPEPIALVRAAEAELSKTIYDGWHHYGWDYNTHRGLMARYIAYWNNARVTHDHAPAVVERTALWQIWHTLTPRHRQAFLALAAHEDYQAAAAAMGLSYKAYTMLLVRARRAFLRLWHEGEAPSRPWGTDRRQGSKERSVTSVLAARGRRSRGREGRAA